MTIPPSSYRRLPGRGVGLTGYSRLFQGPDHLLLVSGTGYSETYKRFYFGDIQAVMLRKNWVRLAWSCVWGALLMVSTVISIAVLVAGSSVGPGRLVLAGLIALACAAPLLINLLLGPTCTCHIQTAVQTEKVACLGRLRNTERVLQLLRLATDLGQPPFSPKDLASLVSPRSAPPPSATSAPAQTLRHEDARVHRLLCWLLLADLPGTGMALAGPQWAHLPGLILAAGTCITALMAAIRQRGTDLPRALRLLPWLALASYGIHQAAGIIYGGYLGSQGKLGALLALSALNDPVLRTLAITSTALSVFLGCFGLIELRQRRGGKTPPPPPGEEAAGPLAQP